MKTKVIKRVIAFALATLIILGTLGYFFSMVAWAATTTTGITNITYELSAKPLKEGNKATVTVNPCPVLLTHRKTMQRENVLFREKMVTTQLYKRMQSIPGQEKKLQSR